MTKRTVRGSTPPSLVKAAACFKILSLLLLALFAAPAEAQNPDKQISLTLDNAPMPRALERFEEESGFKLLFTYDEVQSYKVTTIIKNKPVKEAVEQVLRDTPLRFNIKGEYITIFANESGKAERQRRKAERISGRVIDEDGLPITGATVSLKGTQYAATTDLDGEFNMNAHGMTEAKIAVSFLGMHPKEVKWNGQPITIELESKSSSLDEVVITGYQVIDKRALTSAVTTVKAEDIMRPDALSIDQMLEGQVPDLIYMSNSGEAGAAPKIRIRGTSSIIGNREPLWVVDGIVVNDPVPISAEDLNDPDYVNRIGNAIAGLNPQDIERLDVLKDAAATALYGTKAANGVIVITTKRGHEGKPQIRYTNSFTWKRRPRYTDSSVDVMTSKERVQLARELFADHYEYSNKSSMVGFEGALYNLYNGNITDAEFSRLVSYYETLNTDWFDLLTHDSFSQQHTISLSGGSQRGTYYASVGYVDADDVVNNTTNRRYSAVLNIDTKFSNWLSASFGLKGSVQEREYYQDSCNPVNYAYTANRAIPAYNEDGTDYYYYGRYGASSTTTPYSYNILNELNNSSINQDMSSVTFDANLKFRFTDWLTANAIASYTTSNTEIQNYWGAKSWYAANLRGCDYGGTPNAYSLMPQGGQLTQNNTRQNSWTARLQLDWNKYFGDGDKHNLSGALGFEASSLVYKGYYNVSRGYYPDRGMTFVTGLDLDKYTSYKAWLADNVPTLTNSKSNTVSGYISASYSYNRMLFLNANMRIDGSNNFGDRSNDKLLPIWSVSGSFNFGQLPVLQEVTWLDYLSIKASYGYQGNMLSSQSPVMIIQKGAYNDYYGEYTSTVVRNPNPNLKWERTDSYNLGLEMSVLNNRLQFDGSLYFKRTKDAFMTKTISTVNGYSSYVVNGGNINNDGFSIGITGRPIVTKDWQWSVSTTFSRTINSIESLPAGEEYELSDFLNGTAVVKGKAVGTFYSYKFLGLSPVDGGPMFDDWFDHYEDLVGLSKYDTYTSVLVASGSREPYMQGNFSTQLRYKSLRLSASFNYSLGAKTRLFQMYSDYAYSSGGAITVYSGEIRPEYNLSRDYLYRWKRPGDELSTNIPAIISTSSDGYYKYVNHWSTSLSDDGVQTLASSYWDMYDYSDIRVVSADYLRLSSLSITYELPAKWLQSAKISRLELTATGNNLFTITDPVLKGQAPNQGGFTTIQLSDRPSYSVGLSITF